MATSNFLVNGSSLSSGGKIVTGTASGSTIRSPGINVGFQPTIVILMAKTEATNNNTFCMVFNDYTVLMFSNSTPVPSFTNTGTNFITSTGFKVSSWLQSSYNWSYVAFG